MLTSYFMPIINPNDLADLRSANHINYTKDGLILWQSCHFVNFKFDRREFGRNDQSIVAAIKNPNTAVILEVNHSHWVVAVGKNWITGNYKIADPWFGDLSTIARYKNNITGAAYFIHN